MKVSLSNALPPNVTPLGLSECKLTCKESALFWPQPRVFNRDNAKIVEIHPDNIVYENKDYYSSVTASEWVQQNIDEQVGENCSQGDF